MLRPIKKTDCAAALNATQKMIQGFSLWLCKPKSSGAALTEVRVYRLMQTPYEASWLWNFLNGTQAGKTHLERAQHLADLPTDKKRHLKKWIIASTNVEVYFGLIPTGKKIPITLPFTQYVDGNIHWENLKDLMEAFYLKGLKEGLAYQPNGTPATNKKEALNYHIFRNSFIALHQKDSHEYARQICIICNGELRNVSVDHWIAKSAYPLLSVCADNLVPICSECNQSPNKGAKRVHTDGSFEDWFHPHLRHPDGTLNITYEPTKFGVALTSTRPSDNKRVANLNTLFNLEQRWTREFKGEYRKLYNSILTRQRKTGEELTLEALCKQINFWADGLTPGQPHFEVHKALADSLRDTNRLMVWHADLIKEL
ncbi:hypothetical protein [Pseudomonas shahriarae]|uniref:hypothetical protein n=1 Tax=Pseudomonas shahriarae TaxID=2745512 RepID=UPI00249B94FD|nr:hypothetical protein [Pseudomonas shahriarae]MDI3206795.1 hypothetical protein [Pseudomonas shahriarae]